MIYTREQAHNALSLITYMKEDKDIQELKNDLIKFVNGNRLYLLTGDYYLPISDYTYPQELTEIAANLIQDYKIYKDLQENHLKGINQIRTMLRVLDDLKIFDYTIAITHSGLFIDWDFENCALRLRVEPEAATYYYFDIDYRSSDYIMLHDLYYIETILRDFKKSSKSNYYLGLYSMELLIEFLTFVNNERLVDSTCFFLRKLIYELLIFKSHEKEFNKMLTPVEVDYLLTFEDCIPHFKHKEDLQEIYKQLKGEK